MATQCTEHVRPPYAPITMIPITHVPLLGPLRLGQHALAQRRPMLYLVSRFAKHGVGGPCVNLNIAVFMGEQILLSKDRHPTSAVKFT